MQSRLARLVCAGAVVGLAASCSQSQPNGPAPAEQSAQSAAAAARTGPVAPPTTDEAKIASALSAAPDAISKDASVIDVSADMNVRTLKEGTNGWTCMPDVPTSPGADPMCLDKNGMLWAQAWMGRQDPPTGKMGLGYMLMGGSDASNADPFATEPSPGGQWVDTGPHLMVFNIGDRFDGYPTTPANTKAPYVMFPNTPYAHLMVPVE